MKRLLEELMKRYLGEKLPCGDGQEREKGYYDLEERFIDYCKLLITIQVKFYPEIDV